MKKLLFVFAVALMGLVACNCGTDKECSSEKACAAECAKECCVVAEEAPAEEAATEKVGCQVEGGTCLEDHSCCVPTEEASEEAGHDHADGEDHGHDHADGEDHGHEH